MKSCAIVKLSSNKRLHRTNFTVTFFALRGKKAASKISSVSRALSVTMKLSISIIIVAALVVVSIWLVDIANDKNKSVKITETVSSYNSWECGYQNQVGCSIVFEVKPDSVLDVQRIRYGKAYMAVKINQTGLSGWVFSSKGVQVYAKPNT
jgi:hypothetical protein